MTAAGGHRGWSGLSLKIKFLQSPLSDTKDNREATMILLYDLRPVDRHRLFLLVRFKRAYNLYPSTGRS